MFCFSLDEVYFLLSTTYEIVIEINDVITRLNAMLIDLCYVNATLSKNHTFFQLTSLKTK